AAASRDKDASMKALFGQFQGTPLWAAGLATRAEFLADVRSPEDALEWLDDAAGPRSNWERPEYAELIRARLRLLQRAGRGEEAEKRAAELVAEHPDSAPLLEIQAVLLEERGAEASAVEEAFERAVAKDGKDWLALTGLARSREKAGDVRGAIELLDRATRAHPESPDAAARAARLACGLGDPADCEKRWSALIVEHPWSAEAASALVEIRLSRKETGDRTLDFAERAVLFGGGKPAYAALVRLHEARGEPERAQEISEAMKDGKPIPPRKNSARRNESPAASEPRPAA
ncbi:hypothetical protein K2X89_16760, partial [Myxococcota bacterium]|nr:hypothetical protein [Myxococcota bacterium]